MRTSLWILWSRKCTKYGFVKQHTHPFQHDPSHLFGLSQINGHKSEPESPKKELIVEEEVAHKKPRNEEDLPDFILQAGNLRYLWDTVQDYNQDHESSRESVITERDMKRVLISALILPSTLC